MEKVSLNCYVMIPFILSISQSGYLLPRQIWTYSWVKKSENMLEIGIFLKPGNKQVLNVFYSQIIIFIYNLILGYIVGVHICLTWKMQADSTQFAT